MLLVAGLAGRLPAGSVAAKPPGFRAGAGGAGMIFVQNFLTKEVSEWR